MYTRARGHTARYHSRALTRESKAVVLRAARIALAILVAGVSLVLALETSPRPLVFSPPALAGNQNLASDDSSPPPRISDVLRRLDRDWFPHAGRPLTAFLIALPYALFAIAGRRHAAPGRRPLVEMAGWLLTLYLALHLTDVVVYFSGIGAFGAILTAFACVVWPLLIGLWWWRGRPSPAVAEPGPLVPREGLVAIAAVLLACGAPLFLRNEAVRALGIVALAAGCYWLLREVGGGIVHAALLVLAAVGVYVVGSRYAPAVTLALAVLFVLGSIGVARAGFARERRLSLGEAVVFLLAAAIVVQLFVPAVDVPYREIDRLAGAANKALLLALAAGFLVLLRDHSAAGASSSLAVDLGFAFALAIFYNLRYGVYGAVVVGSGYLLLRHWLFATEAERSLLLQLDPAKIRDGINRLIALHDVERAVDRRRRQMLEKIESGDAKWAEYEASVAELEEVATAYRQDAAAIETSRRALAHGPSEPPWKRGTRAAWLAAMLAIPWCIAYTAVYSGDHAPDSPQWWLDVIATFLFGVGQWPLFALFFGYFYPDIRGRNGLVKALVFCVTLAVPPLLGFTIFRGELPPLIFALWIFQNFIQAMVLGLFAGDYRTLRACGLGWRHLRDVHNLGVLTAYGTSVIVAIGGGLATAVAGDVVDALRNLIQ